MHSNAQIQEVTGRVTSKNDGTPLAGVSVILVGKSIGAQTDASGNYSIQASKDAVLSFTLLGYSAQRINIGNRTRLDVEMISDEMELDEVVVVGYGTVLRKNLTTAVSSVGERDIKDIPVPNIQQALQGKAAGVQILSGGGRPGSPISVQIRGRASINAGNNPLYVVDGVILPSNNSATPGSAGAGISPIANLNSEDIVSVEILKDAAAAAIYGSRGSNGVVLITTKGGNKFGKSQIALNTYSGYQSVTQKKELLNASTYRSLYNLALVNSGLAKLFSDAEVSSPKDDINWIDEVLNKNSKVNSVQLSVTSGGNEKTQFYTSFNYLNQMDCC